MKFTASSALLAGTALLSAMSATDANLVQVSAKPLIVRPGGIVTVTMNFVVDVVKSTSLDVLAGLSTNPDSKAFDGFFEPLNKNNDTKNHTGKHADDTSITIKSAKIFPNTFRPKEIAEIKEEEVGGKVVGETAKFSIDKDDVVQDKEYKITYNVRVGRGVASGKLIKMPVGFQGPEDMFLEQDAVEVLVK